MSALDLIIARGFGPEVQQLGTVMGDEKNRQQNINQVRQIGDSRLQSEAQDRQINDQAMQRQQQDDQAAQAKAQRLQELYGVAEQLASMPQDDPQVQAGYRQIALEVEGLKGGGGSSLLSILQPKPQAAESGIGKLGADLKAGRISQADYDAAVRKATYVAPPGGGVPQSEPLVAVQTDQGPQYLPRSQAAGLPPAQKPEAAAPTLSPKDMAVAKNKRTQIAAARQQLAVVQSKFDKLKGGMTAGPGQGLLPTPGGRAFDAAVNQLRNLQTSVTRVPGVGAMSDFENRLANAALPTRNEYEEVTQQQIDGLKDLLNVLDGGYVELLGGQGGGGQSVGKPAATGGGEFDYVPGKGLVKR